MAEPYIGQIQAFGFNFAPRGWAECDGALLPISENQALFSLLGTTYGGDGRSTFALPDLRGRVMVHEGSGSGLPTVSLGEKSGSVDVPAHSHTAHLYAENAQPDQSQNPQNRKLAFSQIYATSVANPDKELAHGSVTIDSTGSGDNRPPYLGVTICIALIGTFPSRN